MTAVCQVLMNLTQIPQVMMNLRQLRQIFQLHQVYVEEIVSSKGPSKKFLKWYEDDTDEEEEEFWLKSQKTREMVVSQQLVSAFKLQKQEDY
ncbi:hypothetical protein Tco_0992993 [Tanacetum coccineum]|uniref:Uncharacterized protein n=1 Tax=Tanacetum coccineum TaxID=301880 RepID=A0ABQ5F4K9_9ASTR